MNTSDLILIAIGLWIIYELRKPKAGVMRV